MTKDPLFSASRRLKNSGKPVIGCFPLYPPVEIFTSMGLVPVVLWNLEDKVHGLEESDSHIQPYCCGIARKLAQFILSATGACLDGIFSYNACDTLRNLPEILSSANAESGRTIPMLRMHIPQVNREHTNPESYLKNEVRSLLENIEKAYGLTFSPESFKRSTILYAGLRKLCLEAEGLVAKGLLRFSSFCETVLSGYFLPLEEQFANLEKLLQEAQKNPVTEKARVIVSGIMPPPMPVIRAMENAGLLVVANDIAGLRRSYGYSPEPSYDPYAYFADFFAAHFPCTTLLYQSDRRLDTFMELVETSMAEGVIFSCEKFCEYEYLEFPFLEQKLREKGIPCLRLEFGADDAQNTEGYSTRVEAFAELF